MKIGSLLGMLLVGLAIPWRAGAGTVGLLPLGPEIQVNPDHPLEQQNSAVGLALDGSAVVLWSGDNSIGKKARLLDRRGMLLGPQISVNPPPDIDFSTELSVSVNSSGQGVACWPTGGPCNCRLIDTYGFLGNDVFGCSGNILHPIDGELATRVAVLEDGSFVVVWLLFYDHDFPGSLRAVQGRFFDAEAQPAGPVFELARDILPSYYAQGRFRCRPRWATGGGGLECSGS